MAERRHLVEGVNPPPDSGRAAEEQFVYGKKAPATSDLTSHRQVRVVTRVPFTSRIRADFAQAVTRASLERRLEGIGPNTVQEILESALEPWLKANGYLP